MHRKMKRNSDRGAKEWKGKWKGKRWELRNRGRQTQKERWKKTYVHLKERKLVDGWIKEKEIDKTKKEKCRVHRGETGDRGQRHQQAKSQKQR